MDIVAMDYWTFKLIDETEILILLLAVTFAVYKILTKD